MLVKINGKAEELADGTSIQELVRSRNLTSVAVALNGKVVRQDQWTCKVPQHGDEIDIIRHVGGG